MTFCQGKEREFSERFGKIQKLLSRGADFLATFRVKTSQFEGPSVAFKFCEGILILYPVLVKVMANTRFE